MCTSPADLLHSTLSGAGALTLQVEAEGVGCFYPGEEAALRASKQPPSAYMKYGEEEMETGFSQL